MIKRLPVESPVTEYLHAKAARLGIPLSGSFELTPLCNLQCRMCYVRMTRAQQEAWGGRPGRQDFYICC